MGSIQYVGEVSVPSWMQNLSHSLCKISLARLKNDMKKLTIFKFDLQLNTVHWRRLVSKA